MHSRAALVAGLFASVIVTAACGDSVNTPAVTPVGPSSLSSLLLPRLSGNWGGELTLDRVTGGTGAATDAGALDCAGEAFNSVVGEKNDNTLTIVQSGNDLTAKLVSAGTGLACSYTGSVGSQQTFVLHADKCIAPVLNFLCKDQKTPRTLDLVGSSITARFDDPINPTSINGTAAHTYNVDDPREPIAALVAKHTFSALTRR